MNKNLKATIRLDDWAYDAYGTTMAHRFATADLLTTVQTDVPLEWNYNAPSGQDTEDSHYVELAYLLDTGAITTDDLIHFGNILCRYREILGAQGRTY